MRLDMYKHLYRKCRPEELTTDLLYEALDYDCDTGDFTWKIAPSRKIRVGQKAGCKDGHGYLLIGLYGEQYLAHRLAWFYTYGAWPDNKVDHKDGDGLNNRISNLRDATDKVNSENRRKRTKRTSQYLGVSFDKVRGKWTAHIQTNYKQQNLGRFDTEKQAYTAYLSAKRNLHEGCTI
jgi:hypothetical protein